MEKILTIVIPSYNVERFLDQTLESFVDHRILEDIEVLIVDDGSTDGTAKIGKHFEEEYPKSFRLISKINGGHGSTINRGIQECQGKYFKVVDGDDWVNTKGFVKLVEELKTCDADYIVTDYYEVDDKTGKQTPKTFFELDLKYVDKKYWKFSEIAGKIQLPMHALLIRSEILKKNKIRLDEHCFYVDVEYILYPVPFIETVVYFKYFVYMYRVAQSTQSVSLKGFQKHIQNHIDVIFHLTDFAMKYKNFAGEYEEKKVDYVGKRIAQMVGEQITIFMSYPIGDNENKYKFIAFDKQLKQKSRWIYELSGQESGTLRLLRRTGFRGYRWIVSFAKRRNRMEG